MAILFNHESNLRKEGYLFRELANQIRLYESGNQNYIKVRDPNYLGDWHCARDTVKGLELMGQNVKINDLVLASGVLISIQDIIKSYFEVYSQDSTPKIIAQSLDMPRKKLSSLVGDASLAESFGWVREGRLIEVLREMVVNEK